VLAPDKVDKLVSNSTLSRSLIRIPLVVFVLVSGCVAWAQTKQEHPPIIDMHLHAYKVADFGVGVGPTPSSCSTNVDKVWAGWDPRTPLKIAELGSCAGTKIPAPNTDDELMRQTLATLERYNIRAVTSGDSGAIEVVIRWRTAAPDRIIPAIEFQSPDHDAQGRSVYRPIPELRELVAKNKIAVFAEIAPQYDGMSPADPQLEPYFALAEQLDIPVGVHMGEGPPGGPNVTGYSKYRVKMVIHCYWRTSSFVIRNSGFMLCILVLPLSMT
jgi:predicted TIM-barrel fold metal-dependent hydrolase